MPEDLTPNSFKVISAKDKITIPDVEYALGGSGGMKLTSDSLTVGEGDTTFKITGEGIHLGAADFNDAPFSVNLDGEVVADSLTVTGGTIKYGKTSFTDDTNSGYYVSSDGLYFGSVSDATVLKFDIGTGLMSYSGNLNDSLGNIVLDSSARTILKDFDFGTTDYAGAVKAGDITWNTTTGAITGGSGVAVYRGGIVGASGGTPTFSIDATTGDATFAGTLSGASGTFGIITAGTIDGCNVYANNFRYKKNTFQYLLGCADGWSTSISAGGTLTHCASNQMGLSLASALDETSYIQTISEAILIGSATSQAVRWDYDPSLEFWAKINNAGTKPTIDVRLGPVSVDNVPFFGWKFLDDVTNGRVTTSYYDNSLHNGVYISGVNADQWHRYRIQVTKTGADA